MINIKLKKSLIITGLLLALLLIVFSLSVVNVAPTARASSTIWNGDIATSFSGGNGDINTPYSIDNGADLAFLAQSVNQGTRYQNKYFTIISDIYLNDITNFATWGSVAPDNIWTPIGTVDELDSMCFMGHILGNNKTIFGLYCNNDEFGGLFGYICGNSSIENLNFDSTYISCVSESAIIVGCSIDSTISDCNVTNSFVVGRDITTPEEILSNRLGAICGFIENTTITRCLSYATVAGYEYCGGIVGQSESSTISLCIFKGELEVTNYGGGIVGFNSAFINSCISDGTIIGDSVIGGLVGLNYNSNISQNLSFSRIVSGENASYIGALVGSNNGIIANSFYDREITPFYSSGDDTAYDNCGKTAINLVGEKLLTELEAANWTFKNSFDNTYYYPQLTEFYNVDSYSFVAYEISLYYNDSLYDSFLHIANSVTTLPIIIEDGYTITWHTEDGVESWGDTVTTISPIVETSYYAKKIVNNPTITLESEDIDIVYDSNYHSISITAQTQLTSDFLKYQWFYRDILMDEYIDINNSNNYYATKDNTDSGFYYCLVWIDDGVLSSEMVQSRTFSVNIAKADIVSAVPEIQTYIATYNPSSTLSDIVLQSDFYWTYPSTVPTCDRNYNLGDMGEGYSAYYNYDVVNYNSIEVTIYVYVIKATYIDITHQDLTGAYIDTQTLADFALDSGYFWLDDTIKPTVAIKSYEAYYNIDSVNYHDFPLDITLNLEKGQFYDITHTSLTGVYKADKTLSTYTLFNGYYSWITPDIVPTPSITQYGAIYNSDNDNYKDFLFYITVNVLKATPIITPSFVTPAKLFLGDTLPVISIESSDVSGSLSWDSYTLLIGENLYSWTFIPTDTEKYKNVSNSVAFTVLDVIVESIVVTNEPTTITYDALSKVSLDGMVVTAVYNNGDTDIVTDYVIAYISGDCFVYGDTYFDIIYTVNEVPYTTTQEVTIAKLVVNAPIFDKSFYYDGTFQEHCLAESEFYTLDNTTYCFVDIYNVTATLVDTTNYCWDDSSTDVKNILWEIRPKEIVKPILVVGEYTYSGNMQQAQIEENIAYTIKFDLQKFAGDYEILIELDDKDNYCWTGGGTEVLTILWTINKYLVDLPVYTESNFVYNNDFQRANITESKTYLIENGLQKNAGNYIAVVILKDKDNFSWTDGTTANIEMPFTIAKQIVELPVLSGSYIYNGSPQTAKININQAYLLNGNIQTDVGDYTIEVAIDTANYQWQTGGAEVVQLAFCIAKLSIPKPTISGEYVFNGEEQRVNITTNDYYRITEENLKFVNAGSYNVTVKLLDTSNTEWLDSSIDDVNLLYTVSKKIVEKIDLENVVFEYSGSQINYQPDINYNIFVITKNKYTNVGNYTAEIDLKYSDDYKWADGKSNKLLVTWQIIKKVVMMPQLGKTNYYLGYEQSASIAESNLYVVTNNKAVNAGNYRATVALIDSKNYVWSDGTSNFTIDWSIAKAKVNKPKAGKDLFYNGLSQKYDIQESIAYNISGNQATDCGQYSATVKLSSTNYQWTDGTVEDIVFDWNIFYLKGDTGDKKEDITAFSNQSILYTPQKDGYAFDGWYLTNDFSGEKVESIQTISGDTVLYAKWNKLENVLQQDDLPINVLSTKSIIGITVGGVLVLLALALIIYSFIKGKNKI